jgi:hypothetical protein
VGREIAAAELRRIDRLNDAITGAWKSAYYYRIARSKRQLPRLDKEWLKDTAATTRARPRQTREEFATSIRMLAAMYGGTVRPVEASTDG